MSDEFATKAELAAERERLDRVERKVEGLEADFGRFNRDLTAVKLTMESVDARLKAIMSHMGVKDA